MLSPALNILERMRDLTFSALSRTVIIDAVDTIAKAEGALAGALVEMKRAADHEPPSHLKDSFNECVGFSFVLDRLRMKIVLIGGASVITRFIKMKSAHTHALLTLKVPDYDHEKAQKALTEFRTQVSSFMMEVRTELDFPLKLNEEAIKYLSGTPAALKVD